MDWFSRKKDGGKEGQEEDTPALAVEASEPGVELLNPRNSPYDFNQVKTDVLILGSFGRRVFSRIYPPNRMARHWRKVARIEYYDVYVRRSSCPAALTQRQGKLPVTRRSQPYGGL
jgi:hypothetical protein